MFANISATCPSRADPRVEVVAEHRVGLPAPRDAPREDGRVVPAAEWKSRNPAQLAFEAGGGSSESARYRYTLRTNFCCIIKKRPEKENN